ncbi:MAG: RING finger protein, partial [Thermoanaerobaculia bacterium]
MTAEPVCSICMTAVEADDASTSCPACRASYHAGCWTENGGCAVYG